MTRDEFREMLRRHDWYYSYSDDHSVWQAGENAGKRIRTVLSEHPEYQEDYEAVTKHFFSGPAWKTEKAPIPVWW